MSIRKLFRRMNVRVPVALPDPVGEAKLAAAREMAKVGLRPGKPKFVQFGEFWDQRYAEFAFRAYLKLRGDAS